MCGPSPTWTGVCNIIIIKTCVNCTAFCVFDRVLAPMIGSLIPSTLRPVSLHQPCVTLQVRQLLALIESHIRLLSKIFPASIARNPRNGLHQVLASILFVSKQNFPPPAGIDYGQFRLDSLSRSVLVQCSEIAHDKPRHKVVWSVPASQAQQ
jgi:hypothetical protein